jgi:hypothetical protein
VARLDAPLHQISFLIGTWKAQVEFPNGAAAPQRQILHYRVGHDQILLRQVVLHPRIEVRGLIQDEAGKIIETGQDSAGQSVVQVWTPTVPGSFTITGTNHSPYAEFQVRTTLSRFGPNSLIFVREIVSPGGTSQVEAIARLYRVR